MREVKSKSQRSTFSRAERSVGRFTNRAIVRRPSKKKQALSEQLIEKRAQEISQGKNLDMAVSYVVDDAGCAVNIEAAARQKLATSFREDCIYKRVEQLKKRPLSDSPDYYSGANLSLSGADINKTAQNILMLINDPKVKVFIKARMEQLQKDPEAKCPDHYVNTDQIYSGADIDAAAKYMMKKKENRFKIF